MSQVPRQVNMLLRLGICLLALSSLPILPAYADVTIDQSVDNTVDEFSKGNFQRASLAQLQDSAASTKVADQPGAVQLGPIGLLTDWTQFTTSPLPKALFRMGATTLGNRMYVIGGITPTASGSQTVADVYSAEVSLTTGNIVTSASAPNGWRTEESLPPVNGSLQASYGLSQTIAPINSVAVTSVAKSGGGGYIYVIGGNASVNTVDFSSFAVRVATVNANGAITANSWRDLVAARIPDQEGKVNTINQLGLQSASALSFTTNGKTFIYLLGGLQRYRQGTGANVSTVNQGSPSVFYAQVGSDGRLFKPSTNLSQEGWEKLDNIPVFLDSSSPNAGLWDTVAVADHFVRTPNTNLASTDAMYLMGGQVVPQESGQQPIFTSRVYRALILSDGKITWTDWSGTLPQTRYGHAGVTFRGNFYLTGGIPNAPTNNEPDENVLTSYVLDSLELPAIGTDGSNFLENAVLPVRRTFHSMLLIPAGPSAPQSAFVYVLGGRGDTTDADTTDNQGSNNIVVAKIGGSEDVKKYGYPPDAWFYSKTFPINFLNAEVREIGWTTMITRDNGLQMDIELDYRLSSANSCDNPGFSDEPASPTNPTGWITLDGADSNASVRSIDGQNTVALEDIAARCFQYRARLTSGNGAALVTTTPSLLNVSLKIVIPGSPDLKVQTLAVKPGRVNPQAFGGLDVSITNHNDSDQTIAANSEGGGSFFVDLFIFAPGEQVVLPTLPLNGADADRSKGFANIPKDLLTPDAVVSITTWCDQAADNGCKALDLGKFITKPGEYTFVVAVDSYGCPAPNVCVSETSSGGETNNIASIVYNVAADPDNPDDPIPPETGFLALPLVMK